MLLMGFYMRKTIYLFIFVLVYMLRLGRVESPLPDTWTQESKISFTTTILESPQYTDSKTIIRKGIWYIPIKGYAEIIPGTIVRFEGVVLPKVVLGKITQLEMKDTSIEVIGSDMECMVCRLKITLDNYRNSWVGMLQKTLPEPMASLAAGILLGIKGQMPNDFYQALVNTGTLHIVAASGFNVMIVASVLMLLASKLWKRGVAIMTGILGILFYVLIAGASASVVRAGVMGSLTLIAYYFGRPAEARRLLWMAAGIMLLINPLLLLDIGFQLSVGATGGLLYLAPLMKRFPQHHYLKEYLYPTLAATVATLPIILWHFGRVSWISPLVNMLVLPVVPLVMFLSAITLVVRPVAYLLYVPLWALVQVIMRLG